MDPGSEARVTFKRVRDDLLFVGVHPCGRWFDVAVRVQSPTGWAHTKTGDHRPWGGVLQEIVGGGDQVGGNSPA